MMGSRCFFRVPFIAFDQNFQNFVGAISLKAYLTDRMDKSLGIFCINGPCKLDGLIGS